MPPRSRWSNLVKQNLPKFQSVLPADVKVSYEFDQSPYVTRAIAGLTLEGALGALLTGLMVLLFLRDWRSALIVVINIPLSLMAAVLALWITQADHQHHDAGRPGAGGRHPGGRGDGLRSRTSMPISPRGSSLGRAALDATTETTVPRLLAMLCILAMFIPSFFMAGAAKAMFLPLSLAVGFSMVASYLLSSTLVPILSVWVLRGHEQAGRRSAAESGRSPDFRQRYARLVHANGRALALGGGGGVSRVAAALVIVFAGPAAWARRSFPRSRPASFNCGCARPPARRSTAPKRSRCRRWTSSSKKSGRQNVEITLGFVGVHAPSYPDQPDLPLERRPGGRRGAGAVEDAARPIRIEELKERLRQKFAEQMPEVSFSFEPSDIVSRVMSLGSPTPIEVAVSGPNLAANREFAEKVKERAPADPASARRAVRPGAGLSDGGRDGGPRTRRADGGEDGRCVALAGGGHLVEPVRGAELLGRPEQRRGLPGPGAGSAGAHELAGRGAGTCR